MSSNYEWQKFQTAERIGALLREAENHRLAEQCSKDRRFQISISRIARLLVTGAANAVRSVVTGPRKYHPGSPIIPGNRLSR
jgi:hypothetical protein